MSDTFDPAIIDGMFSEPVVLEDFRLVLGLMHPASADEVQVCTWDGRAVRHYSRDAVLKSCEDLANGPESLALRPVWEAMRALQAEADTRNTNAMFSRASRAAGWALRFGDVAGHA